MSSLREDEFRAEVFRADLEALAGRSRPVDLHDRVVRASRRARALSAVAAVAVITMVLAGVGLAVWRRPIGPVLPSGPLRPVILPRGEIPVMESKGEDVVRDQRAFSDGTLTVPRWPGLPQCLSGRLEFMFGGRAVDNPASVNKEVHVVKSLRADVDHDGSEELLVHLTCHTGFQPGDEEAIMAQVVAYSGDRLLGRVVASPPHTDAPFIGGGGPAIHIMDVSVNDGTVRVDWYDMKSDTSPHSSTTYGWDGHEFKQVGDRTGLGGPTGVELSIEASGARGVDDLGQAFVAVDVTVHNSGPARSSALRLAMVAPVNLQPAGPGWEGCLLPSQAPWLMNLTPSPGQFTGAFAVNCPASAIDPGQTITWRFHFLVGDGPNAAVLSASASPIQPDPSIPSGPRPVSDAPALETISVEVDQQPPGGHEGDRSDNTVQVPVP